MLIIATFFCLTLIGGGVFVFTGSSNIEAQVNEEVETEGMRTNAVQWYYHSGSSYYEDNGQDPGFDIYLQYTGGRYGGDSGSIYSFTLDKTTLSYVGDYTYYTHNASSGRVGAGVKVWSSYGQTEQDGDNVAIGSGTTSPSTYSTSKIFGVTYNGSYCPISTWSYYRQRYRMYIVNVEDYLPSDQFVRSFISYMGSCSFTTPSSSTIPLGYKCADDNGWLSDEGDYWAMGETMRGTQGKIFTLNVNANECSINFSGGINGYPFYSMYGKGFFFSHRGRGFVTTLESAYIPTKTGYRFTGFWSAPSGGTQYVDVSGKILASNTLYPTESSVTWYAQWEQNKTTITFNVNGGTFYGSNVTSTTGTIYYGDDYVAESGEDLYPSRAGYVFEGWATTANNSATAVQYFLINYNDDTYSNVSGYTDSSGGWIYCSSASNTLTLYARWRPKLHTLTLDPNGGKFSSVSGATVESVESPRRYGFEQKTGALADGTTGTYFESMNKGVSNSYAMCKVSFNFYIRDPIGSLLGADVIFSVLNYAESNFDYVIFSEVDKKLSESSKADTTNVYKSFKGNSSSSWQTVTYTKPYIANTAEHFIYIKFIKDGSNSLNNDSARFYLQQAVIMYLEPAAAISDNENVAPTITYGFTKNSQGFYESQNKGVHGSFALTRVCFTTTKANSFISFAVLGNSESGYDYAYFSDLDTAFTADANAETSYYNRPSATNSPLTIEYSVPTAGKHFIDIKYMKDGSGNLGYDSLQFAIVNDHTKAYVLHGTRTLYDINQAFDEGREPGRYSSSDGYYSLMGYGDQYQDYSVDLPECVFDWEHYQGLYSRSGTAYTDSSGLWAYDGDVTLYAIWKPLQYEIRTRIFTSEYGSAYKNEAKGNSLTGSFICDKENSVYSGSMTYSSAFEGWYNFIKEDFTLTAKAAEGYHFVGFRYATGSLSTSTDVNLTMTTTETSYTANSLSANDVVYIYAYFKKDNEIYYEESTGTYYVDYGYVPQTAYSTITNATTIYSSYKYFGLTGDICKDSAGNFYFRFHGFYYKFELIKWRLIPDNDTENYTSRGVSISNLSGITLVSDKLIFGAKFNTTELGAGKSYYDSSLCDLIESVNSLETLGSGSNILTTGFVRGSTIIDQNWDQFSSDASPNKVTNNNGPSQQINLRIVGAYKNEKESVSPHSLQENNVLKRNLDYSASCTDFAIVLFGQEKGMEVSSYSSFEQFANAVLGITSASTGTYKNFKVDYWTRNLGTYTNEAKVITNHGGYTGLNMQEMAGVRLAYTLGSATFFGKRI